MKHMLRVLAAGLLLSAPLAQALADDNNPTPRPGVSLGGRGSYAWGVDQDFDDGDWMGGAQLRVYLAKMFAVEGSVDWRQQDFDEADTTVDTLPVQVSGLLYILPNSPVSPYALGGVGWYHTKVRGPAGFEDTDSRFGAHVGGGLQFFLARHWSIDGSYRYIFTDRITSRRDGVDVSIDGDGHMITAGLNFHF